MFEPPSRRRRGLKPVAKAALIAGGIALGAGIGVLLTEMPWQALRGPGPEATKPIYRPDPPYKRREDTPNPLPPPGGWDGTGSNSPGDTAERVTASFGFCTGGSGRNCVIDGDTFILEGVRIRIADIDAPEIHPPRCAIEERLGIAARDRLHDLLNTGGFRLHSIPGRDEDQFGRKLRVVVRNGQSIGDHLVGEGLARTWSGRREPWC